MVQNSLAMSRESGVSEGLGLRPRNTGEQHWFSLFWAGKVNDQRHSYRDSRGK